MVISISSDLSNWLNIGEIACQVMAYSWNIINCDNQLWLFFVSSDELKWDRIVEQISRVWHSGVAVVSDVGTLQRIGFTINDFELPWVLVVTLESDQPRLSVLIVWVSSGIVHFGGVIESIAAFMHLFVYPILIPS
jgi:hypothetical protein